MFKIGKIFFWRYYCSFGNDPPVLFIQGTDVQQKSKAY